jgi:two-component system OmpR family response regulator
MSSMNVLVAEDDAGLASLLARALTARGWSVRTVARGDLAVRLATTEAFDAILLDVMLPGLNGFDACRRLRDAGVDSDIIMLTARSSVDDRVEGLESGADDYLVKPFALRELHARLAAVRRRDRPRHDARAAPTGAATDAEELRVGGLRLVVGAFEVRFGDATVGLRPKECAVLEMLMRRAGQVVGRYELLDACWEGHDARSNILETQIRRLRRKLDPLGCDVEIDNTRGVGYRIRATSR